MIFLLTVETVIVDQDLTLFKSIRLTSTTANAMIWWFNPTQLRVQRGSGLELVNGYQISVYRYADHTVNQ